MLDFTKDSIALKTLENALKNNKLSHAYLVVGEDSLYTDEFIFHFVKAIFCLENDEKRFYCCEKCKNCRSINHGNYVDFLVLDSETSIKKDDITTLKAELSVKAFHNKRIYWLKNIENMTPQAANAILKFLEEPEENIIAILSCKNISAVLPTILSRCIPIKLLGSMEKTTDFGQYEEITNSFVMKYKTKKHLAALELFEKLKTKEEVGEFFNYLVEKIKTSYKGANNVENISKVQILVLESVEDLAMNVASSLVIEKFVFSLILSDLSVDFLESSYD